MQTVGEFEKVSYDQYYAAMMEMFAEDEDVPQDVKDEACQRSYKKLELPLRATKKSAGYDFKAPVGFAIYPGSSLKIPTGIRVKIDDGWWLSGLPRSGLGFKYRISLDNTMAVIDGDYYDSDNEGHIFIKMSNNDTENRIVRFGAGDKFVQAIFLPYGVTYSDDTNGIRNGGMGSTDT